MIDEAQIEQNKKVESEIQDYLHKDKDSLDYEDLSDKHGNKNKFIILGLVIFLAISVFAYISYIKGQNSFAKERVAISTEVPDQAGSGEETGIIINCQNKNNVALTEAQLEITLPENFILKSSDKNNDMIRNGRVYLWNAGKIAARSEGRIRIYGKFIGKIGDEQNIKSILKYKPENFNYTFEANEEKTIKISSIPVELNFNFPTSAKDAEEAEFAFICRNKSERNFKKARLEIEFPQGFVLSSSDPQLAKKDGETDVFIWEGDNLSKGSERTVKVKGMVQSKNEKEAIKAKVYLMEENGQMIEYLEEEKEIAVEKPGVLISQTINGYSDYAAGKNEELNYKITFKNQSGKEIRGMVLKSTLSGNFDFASLKADKGTVRNNEIVWSALNVSGLGTLSADKEESVEFKIKVKDIFPITKDNDKNFTLKNSVSLNSFSSSGDSQNLEKTIARNDTETKVKSFLVIDSKGYFNDDGRIQNGGALPPRVGQKTYYTIHWSVRNLFNDTENIRIASIMPQGVKWTGKYINSQGKVLYEENLGQNGAESQNAVPTQTSQNNNSNTEIVQIAEEKIFYNQQTNEIIWEIPKLKANDGILTSAKEIVFQIEVQPQAENAGKPMTILNNPAASGYDTFTKQNVNSEGKSITTELFDDYSIGSEEAAVKSS